MIDSWFFKVFEEAGLPIAFTVWAFVVAASGYFLVSEFRTLNSRINDYILRTESRITRLETIIDMLTARTADKHGAGAKDI